MSPSPGRPELHVFVREPSCGPVKTRLAAGLGQERARALYEAFLDDLAEAIALPGVRTVVRIEPERGAERARRRFPLFEVSGQGEGDLGARIARAFADAFERGAPSAVVLGSDSPLEGKGRIRELFEAMGSPEGAAATVRPARDGGFVMAGFRRESFRPELLEGIPWSEPSVASRLLANLQEGGIAPTLFEEGEDVDLPGDVERLATTLLGAPELAPATARELDRQRARAIEETR